MDPISIFTGLQALSKVAGGLQKSAEGMTEAARLDSEARLAETQALQRDASSRDELTRHLSSVRSARSANGLSALSPNALKLMKEATLVSTQERLVQSGDDRQRAANLRLAAKSRRSGARMSLLTGVIGAGIPIAQSKL